MISKAELLRNAAAAKKNKSSQRVPSDTLLAKVAAFLNDATLEYITLTGIFPSDAKNSSIVNRFKTVIMANNLSELCYPIEMDGEPFLMKFVATVENDDDEIADEPDTLIEAFADDDTDQ